MMMHDTRMQSERWIEGNIPRDASIEINWAHNFYPFVGKTYSVHQVALINQTDYSGLVTDLASRHPDYIVLSSFHYTRFTTYTGQYPDLAIPIHDVLAPFKSPNPGMTRYFEDLVAGKLGYVQVAEFKRPLLMPDPELVDPTITILKRIA